MKALNVTALVVALFVYSVHEPAAAERDGLGETREQRLASIDLLRNYWHRVIDVYWKGKIIEVAVTDHGRPNQGIAEAVCDILNKHGASNEATVQLIDAWQNFMFYKVVKFERLRCDEYLRRR